MLLAIVYQGEFGEARKGKMKAAILLSKVTSSEKSTPSHLLRQHESLQVCYVRGELYNEGIKGYLPEKRRRITFGEGATRLHLEE